MKMGRFLFASLPTEAPVQIAKFFRLWRDKRIQRRSRRGETPYLSDFSADELRPFADNITIASYSPSRDDVFVFRSGARVRKTFGADLTRRWFSEALSGKKLTIATAPYRAAARVRRPTYMSTIVNSLYEISRIILPVKTNDGDLAFIVLLYKTRMPDTLSCGRVHKNGRPLTRSRFCILSVDLVHGSERFREMKRVLKHVAPARHGASRPKTYWPAAVEIAQIRPAPSIWHESMR